MPQSRPLRQLILSQRFAAPASAGVLFSMFAETSCSYYEELLSLGVRIFEYQSGFVNAKTMIVDDCLAMVDSVNLNMRSFNISFEPNALIFSAQACKELALHFTEDLTAAAALTLTPSGAPVVFSRMDTQKKLKDSFTHQGSA